MSTMKKIGLTLLLILYSFFSIASILRGPEIFDDFKLGRAGTEKRMGSHVVVDGNYAAVTMPRSGEVSVYFYDGMNWEFNSVFKVDEINQDNDDDFISSIAIKGNRIVIDRSRDSYLYIFELQNNEWSFSTKFDAQISGGLALTDNKIIVGASRFDFIGTDSGAVFVFTLEKGLWSQTQVITGSDTASFDLFGSSISVYEDILLVGAPTHNYNAAKTGAAYLFSLIGENYVEVDKLLGSDSEANGMFGSAVDIQNDVALVGAPDGLNASFIKTGAAYVFRNNGSEWQLEDKVATGTENEKFGKQLLISDSQLLVAGNSGLYTFNNNTNEWPFGQWIMERPSAFDTVDGELLLGLPLYSNDFSQQGKIAIYQSSGNQWSASSSLYGLDSLEGEAFGYSVDVKDNEMIVAVPFDKEDNVLKSSVRVLENIAGEWLQVDTIIPSDTNENLIFGTGLKLKDDMLFVSASETANPGAVYFYEKQNGNWVETQKIYPSEGFNEDRFGQTIVLNGNFLFISNGRDPSTNLSAVYVFKFDGSNWVETQKLEHGDEFQNFGKEMTSSGNQVLIGTPVWTENPAYEFIHVYEEVITDQWQLTQSLQIPPGLNLFDEDIYVGETFDANEDRLIVGTMEVDNGHGGIFAVIPSIHSYQRVNGIWSYQFSETGRRVRSGGVGSYDISFSDDVVYLAVNTSYDPFGVDKSFDFLSYTSYSYFYGIEPDSFHLKRIFGNGIPIGKLSIKLDNKMAYFGYSSSSVNGINSGSVKTFDLDPPDDIFENGFE